MPYNNKKSLNQSLSNRLLFIVPVLLALYGTFMIISAEMGETSGDIQILTKSSIKLFIYYFISIILLFLFSKYGNKIFELRIKIAVYWIIYFVFLIALISTRFFAPAGGAYAWIRIGNGSIQPSEFAKFYIIVLAAKLFSKNNENNLNNFIKYILAVFIYVIVVVLIEKDLGSGVVILIIGYVCSIIANYKETVMYKAIMLLLVLLVLVVIIFLFSDAGYDFLSKFSNNYKILRFLAAANPFVYAYDSGYHLVMSLVSIANGGLFGLGYGKSIHKFMNFPNPSTDFILPVIIEENGLIFGFLPIVIGYSIILFILAKYSLKIDKTSHKIVLFGTFMYFMVHFILNVGGVSGLIPLTGVPLLLISSGGSSLFASLMTLGLARSFIIAYNKR